MKKFTAILFAALILVSGMNPVFSAHLCGESVADVKWSFTGENASCGMPAGDNELSREVFISQDCCHNITAVYSVDDNYSPTSFDFNLTPELSTVILSVVTDSLLSRFSQHSLKFNPENSPGNLLARSVSLPDLCTFRI
jgi:hypothetical protein